MQYLDISSNSIGDDGLQQLTESIESNNMLTELHMQRCCLSPKGTVAICSFSLVLCSISY